ncbi:MAG: hypothetical protein PUD25_03805 [Bacilli bacterium]|nr:hypothetical protein [Bacilli bacterium]
MEEKKILENYQEKLQEIEENLKSINHTLNELEIEKGKVGKYEYDSKWKNEESKAKNYRDSLQTQKENLEHILKAYDMVKTYKSSIENLEKVKLSSPQEKSELENDRKRLQELLEKNMILLPQELQEAISKNTTNAQNIREDINKNPQNELNLTEKSSKTIEDYQQEILANQTELKHLEEEIQKLELVKDTISKEEYIKNLQSLKKYIRRERGKLLRNTQIVNCYEIVLNDLERIQEIDETIARDEQDSKEMERDRIILQTEIDKNKKIVPKNIINNLINQNLQSQVVKPNDNVTKKVNNSPSNNLKSNVSTPGKTINFENLNNLSTEELQSRYSKLVEILEKYKDVEDKKIPENFSNIANETESIANLLVSRGASLPLQDNHKEDDVSKDNSQTDSNSSFIKPLTSFNDELNEALNKTIANLGKNNDNLANTAQATNDDDLVNQFRTIFQKNLQNAENHQQEEKDKTHKENLKSILGVPTKQPQETHKENLKKILNPDTSNQESIEKQEPKIQTEEDQSLRKKSENQSTTSNLESSEKQTRENKTKKESKKAKEVTSVRKPKKNIFKRLIAKISSVAVTLVLICAGGTAIAKKITTPKPDTTIENNTNELDNSSDIQTTYSNGNEIYHPELLTDEEIQSLTNPEDSNVDLVDMQPISEPLNEENNNDGFLINDSDNNVNSSEYEDTSSYIENDSPNLTYLDDDAESYTSYEANEYNNLNENSIRIGSEVTVNGNVHRNVFDAYFQENAFTPTFNNDTKRIVLGVGIANGQGIVRKYAYNENANQDIQQMINNGGEVVTVLTANKDKYLASCGNNMQITREQLDAIEEGWYNINDINLENVKGLSK